MVPQEGNMFKILVCDDEGIVNTSFRFIIEKNFKDICSMEYAKNGRIAIELAQEIHPDLIFMDIQMPGINGLDAMKAIREYNPYVPFVILTAFDKFDYAKQAIKLGTVQYLTKPMNKDEIIRIIKQHFSLLEKKKEKQLKDLELREKFETVVPMLESGFINSFLLPNNHNETLQYKELLDVKSQYYTVMVCVFGEDEGSEDFGNPIGSGISMHKTYHIFREIVKEYFEAIIGNIMGNRIVLCIPSELASDEYEERVGLVDRTREMERKLSERLPFRFRIGIGTSDNEDLYTSYKQALKASGVMVGKVIHINDVEEAKVKKFQYPNELERQIYQYVKVGDSESVKEKGILLTEWMRGISPQLEEGVRLKVLELVLFSQKLVSEQSKEEYQLPIKNNLLEEVNQCLTYEELKNWFIQRLVLICEKAEENKENKHLDFVDCAIQIIEKDYKKELTLNYLAEQLDISPYYFSKLFKTKTKKNYSEYLTELRVEKAILMMQNKDMSMKEIGINVGYSDPNYFSRIFKKIKGCSPTEYRGEL